MIEYYSLNTIENNAILLCSCGNLFQVNSFKDTYDLDACPECSLNTKKEIIIKEKSQLFDSIISDIKERRKDE